MKNKFPNILLAIIYLVQAILGYVFYRLANGCGFNDNQSGMIVVILVILFILSVIFMIVNIVLAFTLLKNSGENHLGKAMKFKLLLMPFFILHTFWTILALGVSAVPFLFPVFFIVPFIFIPYAYFILLSSSSYMIVQIVNLRRLGIITNGQCTFHIIMQLLFITDVISSIHLFLKYRKCSLS